MQQILLTFFFSLSLSQKQNSIKRSLLHLLTHKGRQSEKWKVQSQFGWKNEKCTKTNAGLVCPSRCFFSLLLPFFSLFQRYLDNQILSCMQTFITWVFSVLEWYSIDFNSIFQHTAIYNTDRRTDGHRHCNHYKNWLGGGGGLRPPPPPPALLRGSPIASLIYFIYLKKAF